MMTYENLLTNAISDVPAFAKEYQRLMDADMIDSNTGNHIVFGYAFTPVLIGAINATEKSVVRGMLAFLEKMASSDDVRVVEVCDQSVLEELNDEVDWKDLRGLMGPKTKEGLVAIKEYMY